MISAAAPDWGVLESEMLCPITYLRVDREPAATPSRPSCGRGGGQGQLDHAGFFYSSSGFTDECCHLFLASDVMPRVEGSGHDKDEAIREAGTFSPGEPRAMISRGAMREANALAMSVRLQAGGLPA